LILEKDLDFELRGGRVLKIKIAGVGPAILKIIFIFVDLCNYIFKLTH
jgi:hypothetical protein